MYWRGRPRITVGTWGRVDTSSSIWFNIAGAGIHRITVSTPTLESVLAYAKDHQQSETQELNNFNLLQVLHVRTQFFLLKFFVSVDELLKVAGCCLSCNVLFMTTHNRGKRTLHQNISTI